MFPFSREADLIALVDAYEEARPSHKVSLQEDRYAGLTPCPPEPKLNPCAKCGATKRKHGTNPYCPTCDSTYKKEQYRRRKAVALETAEGTQAWVDYRHDCALRAHYPGFDRQAYLVLLNEQGHVCTLCQREETQIDARTGRARYYAVDYDPESEEVRGLVCRACAKVLAFVHADKERALRLSAYIQEWNEEVSYECELDIDVEE